ncbi:MAG: rhamnan synthesis F family protein [Rhodopila sp.]|nr:rhamnan synthesis F family protein [Rhodopila sp.]
MTEPLRLTDLSEGILRTTFRHWARVARRTTKTATEFMAALPGDVIRALRPPAAPLRLESGIQSHADATRIALYVHYSPTGRISDMVRRQLALLGQSGFAIVFISMAARIPESDWQAVRRLCALVVQRQNFGLDFGAWHDLLPEVKRRWPIPDELMLVNDSVLGPIHPLAPVIETMRAGGDGFFGLTENLEGGPHLQSYMLLARGKAAVGDLMHFVQRLHISGSKWVLIQRGELRLARWMRRRGHRVAAVFGYARLVRAAVAEGAERKRLSEAHGRLGGLERLSDEEATALLYRWPLSPMHHMWHLLATRFGGPFLKTELILRNPWRMPGVEDWPTVIPLDAPCPVAVIQAHLETLKPSAQQEP